MYFIDNKKTFDDYFNIYILSIHIYMIITYLDLSTNRIFLILNILSIYISVLCKLNNANYIYINH